MIRYIPLVICVFAIVAAGQVPPPPKYIPPGGAVIVDQAPVTKQNKEWKLIAESRDLKTKWYYQEWYQSAPSEIEVWVKISPTKPVKYTQRLNIFSKKTNTQYIHHTLQFTKLHCSDKRFSIESTIPYDSEGTPITMAFPYVGQIYKDPVIPGSIIENIWNYFCG